MEPHVELRLGDILREKRMSVRELARRAQVRYTTIYGWCNNEPGIRIPLDNLARICVALDVEIADILTLHK